MAGAPNRAMRLAAGVWAAAMLCATAAWAQAPADGVALSDLLGLGPAQVRARLADVDAGWPIQPMFEIAGPDGTLSFITLDDLMIDPVLARHMAVFRTQGDRISWESYVGCSGGLLAGEDAPKLAVQVVLMFRNGQLDGAFGPAPPVDRGPPPRDAREVRAWLRRPQTSPFIDQPGDLPLRDGAGFLSRWGRPRLAPTSELSVACSPAKPPTPVSRAPHRGLDASDMQGLALLPFAVGLPGMNRQREEARLRGHELLLSLHVGDQLPEPAERFARRHAGVRAYGSASDYAVLSIDLGGYASRNLSNFKDAALVGVRNGRIEWIAPPSFIGPSPSLLCLDAKGVPAAPRRGCRGYGQFTP